MRSSYVELQGATTVVAIGRPDPRFLRSRWLPRAAHQLPHSRYDWMGHELVRGCIQLRQFSNAGLEANHRYEDQKQNARNYFHFHRRSPLTLPSLARHAKWDEFPNARSHIPKVRNA